MSACLAVDFDPATESSALAANTPVLCQVIGYAIANLPCLQITRVLDCVKGYDIAPCAICRVCGSHLSWIVS